MTKSFLLLLAAFLVTQIPVKAQGQYYSNDKGSIFHQHNYGDIDGHPYLFETWKPGKATTDKGAVYEFNLKYNIYEDQLIFTKGDGSDSVMAFTEPIKAFELTDDDKTLHFKNGYPAIDKQTENSFYEVIADGKLTLLKKPSKTIMENQAFGMTTQTRKFINDDRYYLVKDGKIYQYKISKGSVLDLMNDKRDMVAGYLKKNVVSFKSDDDLTGLFAYYNTL